jgi:hypothetical protein
MNALRCRRSGVGCLKISSKDAEPQREKINLKELLTVDGLRGGKVWYTHPFDPVMDPTQQGIVLVIPNDCPTEAGRAFCCHAEAGPPHGMLAIEGITAESSKLS